MHLTDQEYAGLSAEDFFARVQKNFAKDNKRQRLGQFFMNSLPLALYDLISGSFADCFYDNTRIPEFKKTVTKFWENYQPKPQIDCAPAPACVPVAPGINVPACAPTRDKDELIYEINDWLAMIEVAAKDMNDTTMIKNIDKIKDLLNELRAQ